MLSPLEIPPLPRLGRWATRIVHGNKRSSQGYLLTKKRYFDDEQEWRFGQCYLGMLGMPLFVIILFYIAQFRSDVGYYTGRRHVLGAWSDLPLDLKILLPLAVAGHLTAMASFFRPFFIPPPGPRDEIGE